LQDAAGGAIDGDSWSLLLDSGIAQLRTADVNERLQFDALLTPGLTYRLSSTMTVAARPGNGAARAFFDESFEVSIAAVPEPSTFTLVVVAMCAISAVFAWRRRR
jgi:hypothetical protein